MPEHYDGSEFDMLAAAHNPIILSIVGDAVRQILEQRLASGESSIREQLAAQIQQDAHKAKLELSEAQLATLNRLRLHAMLARGAVFSQWACRHHIPTRTTTATYSYRRWLIARKSVTYPSTDNLWVVYFNEQPEHTPTSDSYHYRAMAIALSGRVYVAQLSHGGRLTPETIQFERLTTGNLHQALSLAAFVRAIALYVEQSGLPWLK